MHHNNTRFKSAVNLSAISNVISDTVALIESAGTNTYDPFDLFGTSYARMVLSKRTPLTFCGRLPFWCGMQYAPKLTRWLLGTQKRATASGVAHLASFYTQLGDHASLQKARQHLVWLKTTASRGDGSLGWGFPYAWKYGNVYLSPGTPIGHTTMQCGNAFLRFYRATGEHWVVEPIILLCELFDKKLNKTRRRSGSIAVSYTPTDSSQVINVQADIGSLLLRVGNLFDRADFRELGSKLIDCVLETQNSDGSWYYHAFDSIGKPSVIDNHHTGMVLSALSEVYQSFSADPDYKSRLDYSIKAGSQYFLNQLFTNTGIPKWSNTSLYPLDIYNFAQSIITLLDIQFVISDNNELSERAEATLWAAIFQLFELMCKKDGGFLYRRFSFFKQDLNSLRWANALTIFALARFRQERLQPDRKPILNVTAVA